ncbi:unnamed protein product [Cyclocybe aegerita]|uniref:Uncharacterized protein n=1 Tax=Cyclocybe aegerita TaxID=1973307 RepID=A0A8S0VYN8_CYCAE|nr:unnamed protein product [Cyclocybe aegerita]
MAEPSEHQEVDILESMLDQAFASPPPSLKPEPKPEASLGVAVPSTTASEAQHGATSAVTPLEASGSMAGSEDSWKAEYEAQVQSWRAQSAEAREKAEKERLRWEAIRAAEKEEAAKRKAAGILDEPPSQAQGEGWESVGGPSTVASSSQLAELVSVESEPAQPQSSAARPEPTTDLSRIHSRPDTNTDESQKWEDVPSVTSSFPSMTFPENIDTPPPPRPQAASTAPASVTLAIFDSSLSTRTRLKAFASSLAVNLLLPFVNGVMLGFGEIFAKNVVMGWFGWKSPGSAAANVGLRSSSPREIRQRQAGLR